jgi:hypothetical protein
MVSQLLQNPITSKQPEDANKVLKEFLAVRLLFHGTRQKCASG